MFSKAIRKFFCSIILVLSIGNSSIWCMEGDRSFRGDTLHKVALKLDNNREVFYIGEPLNEFPEIVEKQEYLDKIYVDKEKGLIDGIRQTTNIEAKKECLLLASDDTNSILEDTNLMISYDGEVMEGPDRREIVQSPYKNPWNGIVSLEMIFHKDGHRATYFGSGCLINNRFILTAAHNVYDHITGLVALSVKALPGLNNGKSYWSKRSSRYYVNPRYIGNPNEVKYDMALIDLRGGFVSCSHSRRIKEKQPFNFGLKYVKQEDISKQTVRITGFPGGAIINGSFSYLACKTMLTSEGQITKAEDGVLEYNIDTSPGNSGSPIYFEEADTVFCCGIHSSGGKKNNKGVYIDVERFDQIGSWMKDSDDRLKAINDDAHKIKKKKSSRHS